MFILCFASLVFKLFKKYKSLKYLFVSASNKISPVDNASNLKIGFLQQLFGVKKRKKKWRKLWRTGKGRKENILPSIFWLIFLLNLFKNNASFLKKKKTITLLDLSQDNHVEDLRINDV